MIRRNLGVTVLIIAAFLSSVALAQGVISIHRHVMAGGGMLSKNTSYTLQGSIGQPFTARSADGAYQLNGGYWTSHSTASPGNLQIHLPLVQH